MPDSTTDEQSLRALVVSLHQKLDVAMGLLLRITEDRLNDRLVLQDHATRIARLEHQIALLSGACPAVPDWQP